VTSTAGRTERTEADRWKTRQPFEGKFFAPWHFLPAGENKKAGATACHPKGGMCAAHKPSLRAHFAKRA
jgi:hypothetical protein